MANGHGGARPGSGRKPKALRYDEQVTQLEDKIAGMLPSLVDNLYAMAMDGNVPAAKYLIDRILGRVPLLAAAPAQDRSIPYDERQFIAEDMGRMMGVVEEEVRLQTRLNTTWKPTKLERNGAQTDNGSCHDYFPASMEETAAWARKHYGNDDAAPRPTDTADEPPTDAAEPPATDTAASAVDDAPAADTHSHHEPDTPVRDHATRPDDDTIIERAPITIPVPPVDNSEEEEEINPWIRAGQYFWPPTR